MNGSGLAEIPVGVAGRREAVPVVRDEVAGPQASEGLVADDCVFAVQVGHYFLEVVSAFCFGCARDVELANHDR